MLKCFVNMTLGENVTLNNRVTMTRATRLVWQKSWRLSVTLVIWVLLKGPLCRWGKCHLGPDDSLVPSVNQPMSASPLCFVWCNESTSFSNHAIIGRGHRCQSLHCIRWAVVVVLLKNWCLQMVTYFTYWEVNGYLLFTSQTNT